MKMISFSGFNNLNDISDILGVWGLFFIMSVIFGAIPNTLFGIALTEILLAREKKIQKTKLI